MLLAETDGGGGGAEATAVIEKEAEPTGDETPVADPKEAEPEKKPDEAAPKLPTDGRGNLKIEPKADGAQTGDAFDVSKLFDDKGVLLKGKFDSEDDDGAITQEMVEKNPAIQRLLKAHQDHQAEVTKLRQGKIPLGEAMTAEELGGLDFTLNKAEDGALSFTDDTIKALKGRPIGDAELTLLSELIDEATTAARTANEEWNTTWAKKLGEGEEGTKKLAEVIDWAQGAYSPESLRAIVAQLQDPALRDDQMERLIANHAKAHGETTDEKPKEPETPFNRLRTGNVDSTTPEKDDKKGGPTDKPNLGMGLFDREKVKRENQYAGERMAAQGNPSLLKKIDDKLRRTNERYPI